MITQCITGEPCHDPLGPEPQEDFTEAQQEAVAAHCRPVTLVNFLAGSSLPPSAEFPFSEHCADAYTGAADPPGKAKETFDTASFDEDGENILAGKYRDLYEKLGTELPDLDRGRVYLTEYPDPSSDDLGTYCGWTPTLAESDVFAMLPGVTQPEMTWADMTVATFLRTTMQDTTTLAEHDWQFISATGDGNETISSATRNHGYCADANWTIRLAESLVVQQQIQGVAHPNDQGQDVYQQAITHALLADFYPDGLGAGSREPDPRDAASDSEAGSSGGGSGSLGWQALALLVLGCLLARGSRRARSGNRCR